MKLLLICILVLAVFNSIVIDKALHLLSQKELKRRARSGKDKQATAIYRMSAYDGSLNALLWVKALTASVILTVIFLSSSWLVALIFIALVTWFSRFWYPARTSSWAWRWTAMVAPLISKVMNYLHPALKFLNSFTGDRAVAHKIYEKDDLIELLKEQASRPENRIPEIDLKAAEGALSFGDMTIGSVMTPLRQVRMVYENEEVGPLLMDELHASGFSRFPVAEAGDPKNTPKIIGTLFFKDLLDHAGHGKVKDLMDKKTYFVNESSDLRDALSAFLSTHHHLFTVVNNFEEVVGVLSIEDVIEQVLGQRITDEFDKYDDLRAVAVKEAKVDHKEHAEEHLDYQND
jgi:CBS domain containing-hemolysin-like protein